MHDNITDIRRLKRYGSMVVDVAASELDREAADASEPRKKGGSMQSVELWESEVSEILRLHFRRWSALHPIRREFEQLARQTETK